MHAVFQKTPKLDIYIHVSLVLCIFFFHLFEIMFLIMSFYGASTLTTQLNLRKPKKYN